MKVTQETMRPVWDNIEETFLRRFSFENGGPKKGTKAYEKQKCEFFTGAMAALHAVLASPLTDTENEQIENGLSMPAFWVLPLLGGRELKCEEAEDVEAMIEYVAKHGLKGENGEWHDAKVDYLTSLSKAELQEKVDDIKLFFNK